VGKRALQNSSYLIFVDTLSDALQNVILPTIKITEGFENFKRLGDTMTPGGAAGPREEAQGVLGTGLPRNALSSSPNIRTPKVEGK